MISYDESYVFDQVDMLLLNTIAMREQLATWTGRSANTNKRSAPTTEAKDTLLDTQQAETSAGGPSERLNVFEQFKIPSVDSPGKQSPVKESPATGKQSPVKESPATGTQNREKVSGCSVAKKARLSLSSGDATSPASRKKDDQLAQSSSVKKEVKEVFGKFL